MHATFKICEGIFSTTSRNIILYQNKDLKNNFKIQYNLSKNINPNVYNLLILTAYDHC